MLAADAPTPTPSPAVDRFVEVAAGRAFDLDELRESGAQFPYPGTLETWEWAALRAVTRARRAAMAEKVETQKGEQRSARKKADLARLLPGNPGH